MLISLEFWACLPNDLLIAYFMFFRWTCTLWKFQSSYEITQKDHHSHNWKKQKLLQFLIGRIIFCHQTYERCRWHVYIYIYIHRLLFAWIPHRNLIVMIIISVIIWCINACNQHVQHQDSITRHRLLIPYYINKIFSPSFYSSQTD